MNGSKKLLDTVQRCRWERTVGVFACQVKIDDRRWNGEVEDDGGAVGGLGATEEEREGGDERFEIWVWIGGCW